MRAPDALPAQAGHVRPVFCVIGHAQRDRAVAEAVCAGRFSHVGITLNLGVEPNWLSAELPADEEWRIEWSKFYYGLDLAFAFGETRDARFLRTWERLVRSWIRQVPVGQDSSDVAGRRIQNWIYAWQQFASAPRFPGLSAGLADEIVASLRDQVRHLRDHLTPERNHRTLELYALFIAALALPAVDPDGELLRWAMHELHANLLADVLPDGVHRECSTHYHMTALRSFVGARENARRFGLSFPASYDARLERACEFALHCHRPDGAIPAVSDSDTGTYRDVLELAAGLLGRSDFLYAATAGARGRPPHQRYVSFPDAGYFIQRSGWGDGSTPFEQERFAMFDCGPLGDGGHGHYDVLSLELAASGQPLIVDPGRYTYSEQGPNWRRYFKATAAHNTVCVDGLDQTPYRRGKPKGAVAAGRLMGRWSTAGLDLIGGEVHSPAYDAIHARWLIFVADEYWIIADRLTGTREHRYDLRFHLAPSAWDRTRVVQDRDRTVVSAPDVVLVLAPAREAILEPGWYAPEYGLKVPIPVVSAAADGVSNAEFLTLVAPRPSHDVVPRLRIRQPATDTSAMILEVDGVGPHGADRDVVAWSPSPAWLDLGPRQCTARAAWLRQSASGECLEFRVCESELA